MKRFLILALLLFPLWLPAAEQDDAPPKTEQERLQEAGDLYFDYKQDDALEAYIELSKDTANRQAFLNAAFIAMEQNNPKQAVDIMTAAYRKHPQDRETIEMTAEAYLADGQYRSAEKFLSLLPEDPARAGFFHINLARAQMGLGEKKLAKYNLKMAVRADTHPALANYLLGILYEEEKDYKQAAEVFRQATVYDHQFIEAKKHYAAALEKLGSYNEAYRQYRMIYSSEKHLKDVNAALARLKPRLSRPEKEIVGGKEILKHTFVKPLIPPENVQTKEIKIGLGMRQNGRPSVRSTVHFIPSHDFTITDAQTGKLLARGKAKESWVAVLQNGKPHLLTPANKKIPFTKSVLITPSSKTEGEGHTIIVKNVMSGAGMTWASVDDKEYRGKLQITHHPALNTLIPINIVNIEEYLQGVIASEMPTQFPMDALRAQAVLARTYALKHLGKHKYYGYDLCDTQNCQVYGGVTSESERGNAAVESIGKPASVNDDGPDGWNQKYAINGAQATCYIGQATAACSFDTEMLDRRAYFMAEDGLFCKASQGWLPGGNLHRTPFSGRNHEYFSEDANVNYLYLDTMVKTFIDKGISVGGKHFAGNDVELNRQNLSTFQTEQTWRQNSLRGFESSFTKGGATSTMNCKGGIGLRNMSEDYASQVQVLRNEWGFKGVVIADAGSGRGVEGILSGTDMWCLFGQSYADEIVDSIEQNNDGNLLDAVLESNKRYYYAFSRSIMVNGISSNSRIVELTPWWQPVIITVDCVVGAVVLASAAGFIVTVLKKRGQA